MDRSLNDFTEDVFLKLLERMASSTDSVEQLSNENIKVLTLAAKRIAAVYWAEAYSNE